MQPPNTFRTTLRYVRQHHHVPANAEGPLIWTLGIGALGLAWSVTTVAAYLPAILGKFTASDTLIGFILGAEGIFALILPLLIGPLSDATRTPLGRRRPYMAFAVVPLAFALALLAFMPNLWATAFIFFAFSLAYYVYEPPYRGLYPDLIAPESYARSQGRTARHAWHRARGRARRWGRAARSLGALPVCAGRGNHASRVCGRGVARAGARASAAHRRSQALESQGPGFGSFASTARFAGS